MQIAKWSAALLIANGALTFGQSLPLEPLREAGNSVTGAFEGWFKNPDGTFSLLLGYYNRNQKQELDIPVGPNNRVEPDGPDRGQPTHFMPGRGWGLFAVEVPANFGEHPIGTGPWKFVDWKHDDYLLFAKNPDYWGGPPKSDSLRARIIPEPSTAVAEFESGNVDVLYVPEGETRSWEETDDKKALLETAPALRMLYIAINTTRGPLADPRVRQALNYATDARAILDGIMSGRGNLAAGVVPPALPGGDSTRKGYTRDVAKAKQLLAAAGHPNGIDIELWSSQTAPFPRIAQTVQANLADAGVRVKLVQRDASSMREAARAGQTDMALKDWFADYPDAEDFLYPLLHSTNKGVGGNVSFYSNPKFDKLVTDARREQDEAKRVSMYREADLMAFNDAPMIYLFFYKELYAVQPWITGFKVPTIFTGQDWTDVAIKRQP